MKKSIVTEQQKKEVRKYIEKWRAILFLHQWDFTTAYHRDEKPRGVLITMDTEYKNARIEIHVDDFFGEDKEKREEIIVHELCHCIVQPIMGVLAHAANGGQVSDKEFDWHKENITQHFARAIYYK